MLFLFFLGFMVGLYFFNFQIGVDKNDLDKAFVQLTIEFLTKQVMYCAFVLLAVWKLSAHFLYDVKKKLL